MAENDNNNNIPSIDSASRLSQWLYTWVYPSLLAVGLDHALEPSDLPAIPERFASGWNRRRMRRLWEEHINNTSSRSNKQPSLFRILVRDYFAATWTAQMWLVISMAARLGQSLALGRLIEQFSSLDTTTAAATENSNTDGYVWTAALMGCGIVFLLTKQRQFFLTHCKGMTMRLGLLALVYDQALHLPSTVQTSSSSSSSSSLNNNNSNDNHYQNWSSGQVLNLASNDVERFLSGSPLMLYVPYAPLEALVALILGYRILGKAMLAGFAVLLFLFMPLQFVTARQAANIRARVAAVTDRRVNMVSQSIQGARIMKFHGWEDEFAGRIAAIRRQEMDLIRQSARYKSVNEALSFATTVVLAVVTFSVHVVTGGILTSRSVFTVLSLLNIVQSSLSRIFGVAIMLFSECYVSAERLQRFLETPKLVSLDGTNRELFKSQPENVLVVMKDVTCYWGDACGNSSSTASSSSPDNSQISSHRQKRVSPTAASSSEGTPACETPTESRVALENISMNLEAGRLYFVIGAMGSGKSALLQALAGELSVSRGSMQFRPKTAALTTITKEIDESDQQRRQQLARAYAQQDPWIMDGTVRENILFGASFRPQWYAQVLDACCLTSDLHRFPSGDATLVGDRGVQCSGGQRARLSLARALYGDSDLLILDDPLSAVDAKVGYHLFYHAIQELGVKRGKCVVLATHQQQFCAAQASTTKPTSPKVESSCILMTKGSVACQGSYTDCLKASGGTLLPSFQVSKDDRKEERDENEGEVIQNSTGFSEDDTTEQTASGGVTKEHRETGLISSKTWKAYALAMGGTWVAIGVLFVFSVTQASQLIAMVYLGKWAEAVPAEQSSGYWLGLINGLMVTLVVLAMCRALMAFYCCLRASQYLHDKMTRSVLRAKIEFFDTNPLGRILNRFSADVGIADDQLPFTLVDFLVGAFLALGSVTTTLVSLPITLVALLPLIWYFLRLRRVFVVNTREIKRLEGLARSPIYAMIGESLLGVATIRANNATDFFRRKFEEVHDRHGRAFFAFVGASRWFAIRLDLVAFLFLSTTALVAVLFHQQGWSRIEPAVLGLILTLLMQLAGTNFPWVVRQSAEVVNQMISIERVSSYGHLEPESALQTDFDEQTQLREWPESPSISVQTLSVRYREQLPTVLSNVSFDIKSGQRVGIVGRSGSGKSSLVQALFRILEAETGTILIDGVNIAKLGLHKLRHAMSVIPQSPVLFGGCSIRFNLDPFEAHDDSSIREALERVQMLEVVTRQLPQGLDSIVAEGGSNFSVGERQLLCLARALLQKAKILVLDESSANIDTHTDSKLQRAIQESFSGATILAVAHRLETVIDYDTIMVLGDGNLLEMGPPHELLLLDSGHFRSMVESTGQSMAANLKNRAERAATTSTET